MTFKLPYFDFIFKQLESGNHEAEMAFGRHVHWGYWERPQDAQRTAEDLGRAAERLCQMVCDAGCIKNSLQILDVGCGFGGTVASLNERFSPVELVGLNIDERQLARARQIVKPASHNKITFVHGNACDLPFEDNSFDIVLAVECIFHFPDRAQFFREASRVLKPGGRLAFSDFVPASTAPSGLLVNTFARFISIFYGTISKKYTIDGYRHIALNADFEPLLEKDITKGTMPTCPILIDFIKNSQRLPLIPWLTTSVVKWAHQSGQMKYAILAYQKNR